MEICLIGLDKVEVFRRLYNGAKPQGLGFLHATQNEMSYEQAAAEFESDGPYFDYHHGRVMKVDLEGESFDARLYDRDNGSWAAVTALKGLKYHEPVEES